MPHSLEPERTTTVEARCRRARALSAAERARLATALLAALDEAVDGDAQAPWTDDIARRVDEIQTGAVALVAAHEVFAHTARILGR